MGLSGFGIFCLTLLCSGGGSDAEELIRAEGGSVTFRIPNPTGDAAFWTFENDPIVTVKFGDPPQALFADNKYKTRFSISEDGHALTLSQLSMEDAGTYSVTVKGKRSTFTLQVFRSHSDAEELIRAEGGSVTFQIPNPTGDAVFWQFENNPIVTVKFGDPPQALFAEDKYRTRFSISEEGMALSISPLSMEDAGTYSVKVREKKSTFTLQVFRELAEPTVSCESRNCSAGSCSFSLLCSSPGVGVGNVTYTWSLGKQVWDEGPSVWVEKSPQEELEPLRCTARNAVSSRNVTVTSLEKFCAAPPSGSLLRVTLLALAEAAAISAIFLFFHCRAQREARIRNSGG